MQIKNQKYQSYTNWQDFPSANSNLSANLLAGESTDNLLVKVISEDAIRQNCAMVISDSAIRKNSITEDDTFISFVIPQMTLRQQDAYTPEIHASQISSSDQGFSKLGTLQISPSQVGFYQGSFNQISSAQISPTQIGSTQVTLSKAGFTQVSSTQIRFYQNSAVQVSSVEIGSTQINSTQFGSVEIGSTQINPNKISLSSIKSIEELSSIHFFSSYINQINSTVLSFWSTLFDPTFNINFQITDLPKGQLAEAQITNYDSLGRPNGGSHRDTRKMGHVVKFCNADA